MKKKRHTTEEIIRILRKADCHLTAKRDYSGRIAISDPEVLEFDPNLLTPV